MAHDPEQSGDLNSPNTQITIWGVLWVVFLGVLLLFAVRCAHRPDTSRDYPSRTLPPEPAPVLMAAPEIDDEYLPCAGCHEGEQPNREVRELEDEHDEMEFEHGDLWCFHCHDPADRQQLRRADDSHVALEDSWQLCTQCHAEKLADWRAGVHGKRTGHWWGEKQYRPCVACHDPHNPPFKSLEPEPPPRQPEAILLESNHE